MQMQRDSLGTEMGGYDTLSHWFYLQFETLFSVLLEMKSFVWQQYKAPSDIFFLTHLSVQGKTRLENKYFK